MHESISRPRRRLRRCQRFSSNQAEVHLEQDDSDDGDDSDDTLSVVPIVFVVSVVLLDLHSRRPLDHFDQLDVIRFFSEGVASVGECRFGNTSGV